MKLLRRLVLSCAAVVALAQGLGACGGSGQSGYVECTSATVGDPCENVAEQCPYDDIGNCGPFFLECKPSHAWGEVCGNPDCGGGCVL